MNPPGSIRIWAQALNATLTNFHSTDPTSHAYDSVDDAIKALVAALRDEEWRPLTKGQYNWTKMIEGGAFRDYAILCLRVGVPVPLAMPVPQDPIEADDSRPDHGLLTWDHVDDPPNVWYLVNVEDKDEVLEHGFWKPSRQLCGLDSPPMLTEEQRRDLT